VAASPVKLALLAGGSALITLACIGGLAASVQAFGGGAGITEIGAVYPGAIEAALVLGLTGIGLTPGLPYQQSSPAGSPPTGCPSYPDGSVCGS
jgi:hypothetical protein